MEKYSEMWIDVLNSIPRETLELAVEQVPISSGGPGSELLKCSQALVEPYIENPDMDAEYSERIADEMKDETMLHIAYVMGLQNAENWDLWKKIAEIVDEYGY